jgi:hypothetical protein
MRTGARSRWAWCSSSRWSRSRHWRSSPLCRRRSTSSAACRCTAGRSARSCSATSSASPWPAIRPIFGGPRHRSSPGSCSSPPAW